MLNDKLRSQVDALWDKLWTGGLANPLDAIEQFSYLLFMKRLDEQEDANEKRARRVGAVGAAVGAGFKPAPTQPPAPYSPRLANELR